MAKMRALLLENGADESEDDRDRWVIRQRADFCEQVRLRAERDIAEERGCNPCAAATELED